MNSRVKKELLQETRYGFCIRRRRGILHFATALKTATQLPDEAAALITLRLTFGGAPCHASVQSDIPPQQSLDEDIPFAEGRELIVDIPIDPRGYADVYIDDTTGLTVDLPGSRNAERMEAAIPLAIEVAFLCRNTNTSLGRERLIK